MEAKNTASDQLKKLDAVLDEYERSLGIPEFNDEFHDGSAKRYMALSRGQIEKLTPSECAEAALLLGSLSFHMQISYNRRNPKIFDFTRIFPSIGYFCGRLSYWAENKKKYIVFKSTLQVILCKPFRQCIDIRS